MKIENLVVANIEWTVTKKISARSYILIENQEEKSKNRLCTHYFIGASNNQYYASADDSGAKIFVGKAINIKKIPYSMLTFKELISGEISRARVKRLELILNSKKRKRII